MTAEEVWRRKSNEEVEAAGAHLDDYTEEGERIIRAEMHRRGIQQPGPTTRPDMSSESLTTDGVPGLVSLTGTALSLGGWAYIALTLLAMFNGARGGIPNLVAGFLIAGTGKEFEHGKRGGVIWLAMWLIAGPAYLLFRPLPPTETYMSTVFLVAAALSLPAIVVAIWHWNRLHW